MRLPTPRTRPTNPPVRESLETDTLKIMGSDISILRGFDVAPIEKEDNA